MMNRSFFANWQSRAPQLGAALALGLTYSAETRAATLSSAAAAAFDVRVVLEDLDQPTDIAALADGRQVITLRQGSAVDPDENGNVVVVVRPGQVVRSHIPLTISDFDSEQGLLGVVADPDFAVNHHLYFYASAGPDEANKHQVLRYDLGDDGKLAHRTVVIDQGLQGPANHNGGGLAIYGGALYVSVGDTGHNSTPPVNEFATCLNVPNGKILRVRLDDAGLGQPVADNPLSGFEQVTGCESPEAESFELKAPDKRIYAWGLRNPFRFWVDPQTGNLWIGDVGESAREEISVGKDGHYGWPFFEGTVEYDQPWTVKGCADVVPSTSCHAPVHEYSHDDGYSVIGGVIVESCGSHKPWSTRYLFGDYGSGTLWTLDVNARRDGVVPGSLATFGAAPELVSIRLGQDDELYLVQHGGTISRVSAKGAAEAGCRSPGAGGATGEGGSSGGEAPAENAGESFGGAGQTSGGAAGRAGGGGGGRSAGGGASPMSDGGAPAMAGDGGAEPSEQAGAGGSRHPMNDPKSTGCGCRIAVPSAPVTSLALGLAALSLVARRRRGAQR